MIVCVDVVPAVVVVAGLDVVAVDVVVVGCGLLVVVCWMLSFVA